MLPPKNRLTVCFAHVAYRMRERFALRNTGIASIEVFITPHTAGETRHYEHNVLDILIGNLDRLWRGETALSDQII